MAPEGEAAPKNEPDVNITEDGISTKLHVGGELHGYSSAYENGQKKVLTQGQMMGGWKLTSAKAMQGLSMSSNIFA